MAEPKLVTVKLRSPIQFGSETISELVFRPMNAGMARQVKTDTDHAYAMMLEVAQRCCGQTAAVMNQLEGDDLDEVLTVAQGFIPLGRGATGRAP